MITDEAVDPTTPSKDLNLDLLAQPNTTGLPQTEPQTRITQLKQLISGHMSEQRF
jgi:hypothetical protein